MSRASAVTAASASRPLAVSSMTAPGAAASIISPMIEEPETSAPFLRTRISASNCTAVLTKRAAARACSPFWLQIVAIRRAFPGDGAVLLTDMFGGTPSNLAISVMDRPKIEVIAGVNLPMLIKLASVRRTETLERTVLGAQEAGRKYINVASQLLADTRR